MTKSGKKLHILWLALAMLCLFYAMIVAMVGSGTLSFAIWLAGAAFFGLCSFLARRGRWARVPKAARYAAYAVIAVGLVIFAVCQACIFSSFFDEGEANLDYIIVLGAQMRESGPSVTYGYRLEEAADYLSANGKCKCITTGGQGYNEPVSEGEGGAQYLAGLGISPERVLAETKSKDTIENIKGALEIIEADAGDAVDTAELRIGIVTNCFHVFRGVRIAKNMTDAEICGIAAYSKPLYIPNNLVRESLGIIRDFAAGIL